MMRRIINRVLYKYTKLENPNGHTMYVVGNRLTGRAVNLHYFSPDGKYANLKYALKDERALAAALDYVHNRSN